MMASRNARTTHTGTRSNALPYISAHMLVAFRAQLTPLRFGKATKTPASAQRLRAAAALARASSEIPEATQQQGIASGTNKPEEVYITPSSYRYLLDHTAESEALASLRKATSATWPHAKQMQVAPEQGRFLAWLVRSLGVRHAIELGVFTGYSSICLAQGIETGGYLVACESDPRPLEVAKPAFLEAGVAEKINLQVGKAVTTLQTLLDNSYHDHFDFAFVDADKRSYWKYHEQLLKLVRRGGTLIYDNILWYGAAANPEDSRKSTVALRKFTDQLMKDARVDVCFVPIGDGMALCRRL